MRFQLAIFDLDGTILDTLEDLCIGMNHALRAHAMPERSLDEVRRFVGNGIRKLVERAVPEGTAAQTIDSVYEAFTVYYAQHCTDHTKPYEGVEQLLRTVRAAGMQTAVVSNKADYAVQTLCADYFPGMFDAVVGEREGVRRKPCPDSVNTVLEKLGVSPGQAVYIGDSDVDIETAKRAEMPCISVNWGFRTTEFLIEHGAEQILSAPAELEHVLMEDHDQN